MKYLLLVTWNTESMNAQTEPAPGTPPPAEEEPFPWVDDLRAAGIWQVGDQLAPPRRARTVRVRDGKRLVTDGPFTETKESVGGFSIFELPDKAAAIELAKTWPGHAIEIRPIVESR